MQNVPSVSIIVPVYNAEPYLHRSMDSLLNQTLQNIEILLINDGSTDNSGKLCDNYAAKDSRVKVFHRTNHGTGATRQFGLKHVTGEYVIHADPDDWLDLDMLGKMYKVAKKEDADLVVCDIMIEYGNKQQYLKQHFSSSNPSQIVVDYLNHHHGSCCNKLIRTSCIQKYQVDFVPDINIGEDRIFNLRLLQNPIKVANCPNTCYHYDRYSNAFACTNLPVSSDMVYKQVHFIQKLHEYQTTGFDAYGIALAETPTAYMAIQTQTYSPAEFLEVFSHLKTAPILRLPDIPLYMRLIVWTAFHINYRTALLLFSFKQWFRRNIKRIKD